MSEVKIVGSIEAKVVEIDGALFAQTEDGLTQVYETALFPGQARFQVIRFNNMLYQIRPKSTQEPASPAEIDEQVPAEVKSILQDLRQIAMQLETRVSRIDEQMLDLEQEYDFNRRSFEPKALKIQQLIGN